MASLWLKTKIWTKTIVFSAAGLYGLLFVYNNSGQEVGFWYWFRKDPYKTSMLVLVVLTFLAGVVGTLIVKFSLSTVSQIKELRHQSRQAKIERDLADMKAKAAQLKTKIATGGTEPVENDPNQT